MYISVDTSTLVYGFKNNYLISDSSFQNITLKSSLPAIIDSKYSNFTINNIRISNLNLFGGLFNEESNYLFNNVIMKDITTTSRYLLFFTYHNTIFNNVKFDNINCYGDSGDSSLIFFDSGEKKKLDMNEIIIQNIWSNGPLIKIKGSSSELIIQNSTIEKTTIFGPMIENNSDKSITFISNVNFMNNVNNNKGNCGSIHLNYDMNITILESSFINNNIKSNGGVICIDNINNLELNIINNTFIKNNAINGGALYLRENNENKNYDDGSIIIKNNVFKENKAENFGGAIYSEYNKMYLANVENNTFSLNNAGIMGNIGYSPKNIEKTLFNIKEFNSSINDFTSLTTKPAYINITIDTTLRSEIYTGDLFPLKFFLYDELGHLYEDKTKYYSSMTIKVLLREKYDENNEMHYKAIENICSFVNGKRIKITLLIYIITDF
ncbi:hypothetical protein BCR36DRAFT_305666 [Piromyces finnis]|uniref:Right handed beta helix domain-containing protein n=1 Tax=Piromyces finnis TaxID=1754191 RepID=A0A1Y1UYS4_9FUNG|nr:hypothetical protein BCR36DRAFT_305666 [Piromyces finnis]|eukprot:ORX42811.1 hypothetical protein BCR36DRAFT_305666 [Piromyces finnis]